MSKSEIRKYLTVFLKEKGVIRASLFGSYARGENNENSDIDLIIQLNETKNLFDLAEIKSDLEDKFHKKVDVLTYNSISPLIKDEILKEQEILF